MPELLARDHRLERAGGALAVERVGSPRCADRVAIHREAHLEIGPNERVEARAVARDGQHDGRPAERVVDRTLTQQLVPVVGASRSANAQPDHPGLLLPRSGVGAGEATAARPALKGVVLRILGRERRIALHDATRWVEREPLPQGDLTARQLGHRGSLERPRDGLAVGLPPPTAGRAVLEHRVELIHADEPESLGGALHRGIEYPASATDRAIGDEHLAAGDRVADMMVVADELQRIRPRVAVDLDTDDEPVERDGVRAARRHGDHRGLPEDRVRGHHEVELVGDRAHGEHGGRHEHAPDRSATPLAPETVHDECNADPACSPAPGVEHVRHVEAAHPLRARHRHDEVDVRDLENEEQRESENEGESHWVISATMVMRDGRLYAASFCSAHDFTSDADTVPATSAATAAATSCPLAGSFTL